SKPNATFYRTNPFWKLNLKKTKIVRPNPACSFLRANACPSHLPPALATNHRARSTRPSPKIARLQAPPPHSVPRTIPLWNHRQPHSARLLSRAKDGLRRFLIIRRFRVKNIRNVSLRVAIVQWKPARLDLHHDPVARQEHMIDSREHEAVALR